MTRTSIISEFKRGNYSLTSIANKLNSSRKTILRKINEEPVLLTMYEAHQADEVRKLNQRNERIQAAYANGDSIYEIAHRFDLAVSTVRFILWQVNKSLVRPEHKTEYLPLGRMWHGVGKVDKL